MRYGLVGKTLSHSFSKPIHERLADYTYDLMPMDETAFDRFMAERPFAAINVTIPYKQRALSLCDEVDPLAAGIGAVNTVVNRGGRLYGYNTDFDGFACLLARHGIALAGRTLLICGNGGTTRTIRAVARSQGTAEVLVAGRTPGPGVLSYEEAARRADVQVIANASPVGMYPHNGASPIALDGFPNLEAVADAVYNPLCTRLVLDARARGIVATGGLEMLVAQAKAACELFTGRAIPDARIDEIYRDLLAEMANVVLIGMPGSGKTALGRALAEKLGLAFADMDDEVCALAGSSIPDIFAQRGEDAFRDLESEAAAALGRRNGLVIASGGGAVLRDENVRALRQNGMLLFIHCPAGRLAMDDGRPLAKNRQDLQRLEAERLPRYRAVADTAIDHDPDFDENLRRLVAAHTAWLESQSAAGAPLPPPDPGNSKETS